MSSTRDRAGRLVKTFLAWAVTGGALWIAAPALGGVFLLPPLFVRLARGLALIVLPVALAAAWRYPHLGGDPPGGGEAP